MDIPRPTLERMHALYIRGLHLQAYAVALGYGPFRTWSATDARLLAGRLAVHLGAPRLGAALHLRAWRRDPAHPEAHYRRARILLDRAGPLAAWRFLGGGTDIPAAAADLRAATCALRAGIAARFRDFECADAWLDRAREAAPDDPWVCVERAFVLELEDRAEESLASAQRSLTLRPWFPPGVQAAARYLSLLGRDEEAVSLLGEAAGRLESAAVLLQLALLHRELGHWRDVGHCLERCHALSPLLEPGEAHRLALLRADIARGHGDTHPPDATPPGVRPPPAAGTTVSPGAAGPPPRRVSLDVEFVHQHHLTCSPATIAALCRYWSVPVDHLRLAEAICYAGTPAYRERAWAEENNWCVREFSVTWDGAVALLDRGIPFALAIVEATAGHMLAVIGYDARQGTLLLRDPAARFHDEVPGAAYLARYRSSGPRGLVLVPRGEAWRLARLGLPDAQLFDVIHRLEGALLDDDRDAAWRAWRSLETRAPGHPLTIQARRCLADYDGDRLTRLACTEELRRRFPEDLGFLLDAVEAHAGSGDHDRAQALLSPAEGRCPRSQWLRSAAALATCRGEPSRALALWLELCELEPLALDAQRAVVQLLAAMHGRAAAAAHLERAAARFPDHAGLQRLWLEWLGEERPAAAERVARRLADTHPTDAAAHLALAQVLERTGRLEAAAEAARPHSGPRHRPSCADAPPGSPPGPGICAGPSRRCARRSPTRPPSSGAGAASRSGASNRALPPWPCRPPTGWCAWPPTIRWPARAWGTPRASRATGPARRPSGNMPSPSRPISPRWRCASSTPNLPTATCRRRGRPSHSCEPTPADRRPRPAPPGSPRPPGQNEGGAGRSRLPPGMSHSRCS